MSAEVYGIWCPQEHGGGYWLRRSDGDVYHTPYRGVAAVWLRCHPDAFRTVCAIGEDGYPIDPPAPDPGAWPCRCGCPNQFRKGHWCALTETNVDW